MTDFTYPYSELELKNNINRLQEEWLQHIINVCEIEELKEMIPELFVFDGFYPQYTQQRIKILFIGRESLEIGGRNYIETLFDAYHNKSIGVNPPRPLNQDKFHSTMLYLAYALQHKIYDWFQLPYATEFVDDFGKENGISFAFMNISKFSNESGNWPADNNLINTFIELSMKNKGDYFSKEIDLLNPDIIIGMNLKENMKCLGFFSDFKYYGDDVCFQTLTTTSNKQYNYIDSWHFSAPGKSPNRDIFSPIINSILDNLNRFKF